MTAIYLLVEEDNLELVLASGLTADYHSVLKLSHG